MRKTIVLILTIALTAGFSLAKDKRPSGAPEGFDELTKQKGHFKTTLIHPNADFSKYNKLIPTNVRLEFRDQSRTESPAATGSLVRKRSKPRAVPDSEDVAKLAQIINDALTNQLGRDGEFQLVQEAGPDTLVVRVAVTDIVCDISSESARKDEKQKPFAAQGTIVFDLIDAETGVIQARIGERRKSGKVDDSVATTDVSVEWTNVCAWAEHAAADLSQELERVRNEAKTVQTGTGA